MLWVYAWFVCVGGIDEIRVYSRVLSSVEIGQLYAIPSVSITTGLVTYLSFDKDKGLIAKDLGGTQGRAVDGCVYMWMAAAL